MGVSLRIEDLDGWEFSALAPPSGYSRLIHQNVWLLAQSSLSSQSESMLDKSRHKEV